MGETQTTLGLTATLSAELGVLANFERRTKVLELKDMVEDRRRKLGMSESTFNKMVQAKLAEENKMEVAVQ